MSADNGIYILKTKDKQYRAAHAQAIEDLWWNHVGSLSAREIIATRAVQFFGGCRYTRNEETALKIANAMDGRTRTEYGVKIIETKNTWKQIVEEAKRHAASEIEHLKRNAEDGIWRDYHISELEKIIAM